jgi:putative spermidine/putrescine transport system permease protein
LVGGIFGFFVAYAITVGNAPRWMRNILMTFSGLAANFGGVPLAFAFIATLGGRLITAILKAVCFNDASGGGLPVQPIRPRFHLYSMSGLG